MGNLGDLRRSSRSSWWARSDTASATALVGISVVRPGGGTPGPLAALVRAVLLCLVIPAVIFDPDQRGLHDKAMNTLLIRR